MMSVGVTVVEGIVTPDGTLEVRTKLALPAGRVQVTVVPMPDMPKDDPFWQMMERIWADQRARGHVARSVREVAADRDAMRQEWNERMERLQAIQAEADAIRRSHEKG
jgi:hypothetical protein